MSYYSQEPFRQPQQSPQQSPPPQEDIVDRILHRKDKSIMNFILIGINVAVFIFAEVTGGTDNMEHMMKLGATYAPLIQKGEYYRLFTSMFLHFGFMHLLNNMLLLFFLGDYMERFLGKVRFLIVYLGGGILGNVVSYIKEMKAGEAVLGAGASGAIFALAGALIILLIRNKGHLEELTLPRALIFAALSLLVGFQSAGVDGFAHLGGFFGGALLALIVGQKKNKGYKEEKING